MLKLTDILFCLLICLLLSSSLAEFFLPGQDPSILGKHRLLCVDGVGDTIFMGTVSNVSYADGLWSFKLEGNDIQTNLYCSIRKED